MRGHFLMKDMQFNKMTNVGIMVIISLVLSKMVRGKGWRQFPQAISTAHHLDRQLNFMTKEIYIKRNASLCRVSLCMVTLELR